jgi:hypothetical protein
MLILRGFVTGVAQRILVSNQFAVRQRTIEQIMTPR